MIKALICLTCDNCGNGIEYCQNDVKLGKVTINKFKEGAISDAIKRNWFIGTIDDGTDLCNSCANVGVENA